MQNCMLFSSIKTVKLRNFMHTVFPAHIRKTREEIYEERRATKKYLRTQLYERGDIAHIHKLMDAIAPISYNSVSYALNPNNSLWSQRVVDFVQEYIATRDALRNGETGK